MPRRRGTTMRRARQWTVAAAVAGLLVTTLPASGATPRPGVDDVGAPGIGDPYFQGYGNGGYDVGHYDIRVQWFPGRQRLVGTETRKGGTQPPLRRDKT